MVKHNLRPCVALARWVVRLPRAVRVGIAWVSITAFCSLYYLIPLTFAALPLLAACGRLRAAAAVAAALWALACAPMREWRGARKFCQIYYDIFRVRHNLSDQAPPQCVTANVNA